MVRLYLPPKPTTPMETQTNPTVRRDIDGALKDTVFLCQKTDVSVKIEPITGPTAIDNKEEGKQTLFPGGKYQHVVTGVKGERYGIPETTFREYVEDPEVPGYYHKPATGSPVLLGIRLYCKVTLHREDWPHSGEPGGVMIIKAPQDFYCIGWEEFKMTYDILPEQTP